MKQYQDKQKQDKKRKGTVKILLTVLLIIILLLAYRCTTEKGQNETETQKASTTTEYENDVDAITEIDISKRQEAVDQAVAEGMMHVNYLPETVFEGTVSKTFNVKNVKNNHGPIQFVIYDASEGLLYESKLIAPGYEMNAIKLAKELEKGTHNCTIKVRYAKEGSVVSAFPIKIEVR